MLFKSATYAPVDGSGITGVNQFPSSIPIPTPADNPTVIASFIAHYVQNLSRPTALEPLTVRMTESPSLNTSEIPCWHNPYFWKPRNSGCAYSVFYLFLTRAILSCAPCLTLFASLQRLELLKGASVNVEPIYPIQPISTVFGIIDELSEEFWQSLDESKRAQWKWLANDIQQLCDDKNVDDTCRISQDLFSDATGTVLPVGWIDVRVQRITTKCLLRSPKINTTPLIDVNAPCRLMMNEAGPLPCYNRENDLMDVDALWNEAFGHWTDEDWEALAAAATVEPRSPLPCHLPTPESMNGDMEFEYGSEIPSKYIPSELESSGTNPELKLECESEPDEF